MDYYHKYKKYKIKYNLLKLSQDGGGKGVKGSPKCIKECLHSHSQNGESYIWLNVLGHGDVIKVEFEEPVNSGNWRVYTDKWWETHCKLIDHHPDNLADAHIKAFVNEKTRFAKKRFTFKDGTVTEPTAFYYVLEQEYFKIKRYCTKS